MLFTIAIDATGLIHFSSDDAQIVRNWIKDNERIDCSIYTVASIAELADYLRSYGKFEEFYPPSISDKDQFKKKLAEELQKGWADRQVVGIVSTAITNIRDAIKHQRAKSMVMKLVKKRDFNTPGCPTEADLFGSAKAVFEYLKNELNLKPVIVLFYEQLEGKYAINLDLIDFFE